MVVPVEVVDIVGEARQLTTIKNGAGAAEWSPDGSIIAFAARVLKETPPEDKEARERWNQRLQRDDLLEAA